MVMYEVPQDEIDMMRLITMREIDDFVPDGPGEFALNIGAGNKHIRGAQELDLPHWDSDVDPIPFRDGSIDSIYAIHILEHVKDPVGLLRECQRVLKPGGRLNVGVPYYASQGAVKDLDHKSFWCEDNWRILFTDEYYDKNHNDWKFRIGTNLIFGLAERNLMLFTQLIREP